MSTTALAVADQAAVKQSFATLTDPSGVQRAALSLDTPGVACYRASANFTPTATGALCLISIKGSATKTVRVKKIIVGGVATALGQSIFQLQRVSASGGAGGTAVLPTVALTDLGVASAVGVTPVTVVTPAATATVTHFTTTLKANGTAVGGPITTCSVKFGTVTTDTVGDFGKPQFLWPENGNMIGSPLVLRGTADLIEVQNLTPANLGTATVIAYAVEWEEDNS